MRESERRERDIEITREREREREGKAHRSLIPAVSAAGDTERDEVGRPGDGPLRG